MWRLAWVTGLAWAVGACAPTAPNRVREYTEDGVLLYQKGSFTDARDSFQAALTLQPGDADLLYNLGQCYDQLGNAARAEQLYEQCLARAPDHAECWHALTVLLVKGNRRDEAVRRVEEWLRRKPDLAGPYAEDGWLRGQEGDLVSARGRLQQALAIDPGNTRALTELGRIYEALDRPAYAVVLYERALQANPHQPDLVQRVSLLRARGVGRPHPD
jgi:tetratricopeptide (TPR) repeat protein